MPSGEGVFCATNAKQWGCGGGGNGRGGVVVVVVVVVVSVVVGGSGGLWWWGWCWSGVLGRPVRGPL